MGVLGAGQSQVALFRVGMDFKEFKIADQLADGWVIQEIQTHQAMLTKDHNVRVIPLGGN